MLRVSGRRLRCLWVLLGWCPLLAASAAFSGSSRNAKPTFSKPEAAITMIGTLSYDALIKAGLGAGAGQQFSAGVKDADAYLRSARFAQNPGQGLKALLSTPASGDVNHRMQLWNTMNSQLSSEAKRVSPELGIRCLSFGTCLQSLHTALSLSSQAAAPTPQSQQMALKLARTAFAAPMGTALFQTGRELPLPPKMRQHLDAAELTDTTSIASCRVGAEHLRVVLQMCKAIARDGPKALDRFPEP